MTRIRALKIDGQENRCLNDRQIDRILRLFDAFLTPDRIGQEPERCGGAQYVGGRNQNELPAVLWREGQARRAAAGRNRGAASDRATRLGCSAKLPAVLKL